MTRRRRSLDLFRLPAAAFAVLLAASALAAPAVTLDDVAFLTGSWCSADGSSEEHWIAPKGGMMLGVHRTVRGDRTSFEFLRVEPRETGLAYVASPQGGSATAFAAVEAAPGRVIFENPEHDFPTRILYELREGEMTATIEGEVAGETRRSSWRWKRCP
jgi:hypothetical protein